MEKRIDEAHSGCLSHVDHDRNVADYDLLSPLSMRGVELKNRIVMSPMCQYSAEDGFANNWHFVHLGSRAAGGAGLIFLEATAVTPQGRISPKDTGLWDDEHIEPLEILTEFVKSMGAKIGIQLAHAGRKGSCTPPWQGGETLPKDLGGWDLIAPSPIPFLDHMPKQMDKKDINEVIEAFRLAAHRALRAGFQIIEIHSAHGYLLHEFLSPLSNQRTDAYGGSLENRMRFLCQITETLRSEIPKEVPLFVRISATDWVDGGWDLSQSIELAKKLKTLGVDLIDVSSGGIVPHAKIPVGKNYQVPFANSIRDESGIMTGAVGLITEPQQANEIITAGQADLTFIGREFLREPYWGIKAEQALSQEPHWPKPYGYAVKRHVK